MCAPIIPVAAENDLFSIGGKHRKCIEGIAMGKLGKIGTIFIDHIEVKRKTSFIFIVRSKDDSFTVRKKSGRPVRLAKISDLVNVGTIRIRHKNFHI